MHHFLAEIMGGLYFRKIKHDPLKPHWHERDYFVNSKAHSAPGFFATLAVSGYFPISEMDTLRKFGARLQGHPVRYSKEQEKAYRDPGYSGRFGRDWPVGIFGDRLSNET